MDASSDAKPARPTPANASVCGSLIVVRFQHGAPRSYCNRTAARYRYGEAQLKVATAAITAIFDFATKNPSSVYHHQTADTTNTNSAATSAPAAGCARAVADDQRRTTSGGMEKSMSSIRPGRRQEAPRGHGCQRAAACLVMSIPVVRPIVII
jgi:hypothetical protein